MWFVLVFVKVLLHQVSPTEHFEPFTSPSKCVGHGTEKVVKGVGYLEDVHPLCITHWSNFSKNVLAIEKAIKKMEGRLH
ncbi:hypothetical protein Hdeb2414_s0047g00748041 [Helianthus debilis subsp. tardiflorus]